MTPTPAVSAKEKALLSELFALVQGECPSLLDEDSGGNAQLCIAIEAALSATEGEAWFCGGCGQTDPSKRCLGCLHDMRASPPSAPAGVKVKPLEWRPTSSGFCWLAASAVGQYFIEERHSDFRWNVEGWPGSWAVNTFEEASAAAQADYESRIRSSLQPDTQAATASAPEGDIQELASASVRPEPNSVGAAVAVLNKARMTYVNVVRNRSPEGSTSADRRHSEGEISSSAAEAMFEEFGALTFEHVNALIAALSDSKATLADANSIASAPAQAEALANADEQTDRYHKRPFTNFAGRDEKRRKQIVRLPMDVLLAIIRERLEYLRHGSDLDAVTQNAACEIERAMGVFPNLLASLSSAPAQEGRS